MVAISDQGEDGRGENIIGSWGADLDDYEYAQAVTALGVLEASGTKQYAPSSNPEVLRDALAVEFEGGEKRLFGVMLTI